MRLRATWKITAESGNIHTMYNTTVVLSFSRMMPYTSSAQTWRADVARRRGQPGGQKVIQRRQVASHAGVQVADIELTGEARRGVLQRAEHGQSRVQREAFVEPCGVDLAADPKHQAS